MTRIAIANLDAAEAFEAILKHEHIKYEKGTGCGCTTFDVESVKQVAAHLYQWDIALMRVLQALRADPDFMAAYTRGGWDFQTE